MTTSPSDLSYEEARRQARAILGGHADVEKDVKNLIFPARVGVWMQESGGRKHFVTVGAGATFTAALADAKKRQLGTII